MHQKNLHEIALERWKMNLFKRGWKKFLTYKYLPIGFGLRLNFWYFYIRREKIKTVHYVTDGKYMGPKTLDLVPDTIIKWNFRGPFRKLIISRKPDACSCSLCKTFICQVGFIYHHATNLRFRNMFCLNSLLYIILLYAGWC